MEQAMITENNRALLRGELAELPVFSHENHGRRFDTFVLEVERLSGVRDRVRVIAEERMMERLDPTAGEKVEVEGQVRSYNNRSGQGRRLIITVYAFRVEAVDGPPENEICLQGRICREPVYRRTPLGREIADVMLAVERKYGRSDYLPCIAWGLNARRASQWAVGDRLSLRGRIQSRDYIKVLEEGCVTRTAFEVSASELCLLTE